MTRKTQSIGAFALFAAVAATACGKDSTEPVEATLDQVAGIQIASTLMSEIITIGFSTLSRVGGAAGSTTSGVAAAPAAGARIPITRSVPCQGGGSITVQGSYTNDLGTTGTGTVAFDLRQRPSDCVMSTSQGAYTVNGNPEFAVAGTLTVAGWSLGVFHFVYDGGFRWSGPGGSGSCAIDLTYDFDYANSTFTGAGHMCGYPLNFNHAG